MTVRRWVVLGTGLGALLAVMALLPGVGEGTARGFVRVNRMGYADLAAKRAFLMAPAAEKGATFRIVNSRGTIVHTGPIGADRGSWSRAYPHVYSLDFDSVTTPGTYHIAVSGPLKASSPSFRIGAPAALYRSGIAHALYFYENERDGAGYIRTALRTAPGHLNDRGAHAYLTPPMSSSGHFSGDLKRIPGVTVDAMGGWWDAGDYLKFVETTSYTVAMLAMGVRDFPALMGASAGKANFTAEVNFGTRFVLHMWDERSRTLYYQVGIGNGNANTVSDHDIWRLPQADDHYKGCRYRYRYICHRPVFRAAPPGSRISPNLAGRLAADMALCFELNRHRDRSLADRCLLAGEHIFDLADTSPRRLLTTAPRSFYPETEWRDDLELGATELYYALHRGGLPAGLPHTNPLFYLKAAARWAHRYITGPHDAADTLNLYDVSGIAHFELDRAIAQAGHPAGLAVSPAQLLADLSKQLNIAVARGTRDPFGFGFPWASYDTTTHGAGLVVMAGEYDRLTDTNKYAAFGAHQLANILGANAWGVSLIVGDGTTFAQCMQHQVANLVGSRNGSPPVLSGATVEGPNSFAARGRLPRMRACPPRGGDRYAQFNGSHAVFRDNVQSYSTVEPAIDLTAATPLAFAWQISQERRRPKP